MKTTAAGNAYPFVDLEYSRDGKQVLSVFGHDI